MALRGSVHEVRASLRKSLPGMPISSRPNPEEEADPEPPPAEGAWLDIASKKQAFNWVELSSNTGWYSDPPTKT